MTWNWWEQYDEVADELEACARAKVEPDNSLLFRAADDIRTLTDGLRQKQREEGDPTSPEEVLATLPRDSAHAKHLREALKAAREEEASRG